MTKLTKMAVANQPQSKFAQIKDFASQKTTQLAVLAVMSMTGVTAHAETVSAPDLSPIVTMINSLVAVVGSVGMAVLSVYATAKVFKWVKTAF